jgi:hypothetical protein
MVGKNDCLGRRHNHTITKTHTIESPCHVRFAKSGRFSFFTDNSIVGRPIALIRNLLSSIRQLNKLFLLFNLLLSSSSSQLNPCNSDPIKCALPSSGSSKACIRVPQALIEVRPGQVRVVKRD